MTRDGNSATRYTTAFLIGLFFADGPDNTETDKWQQVYKQLPTLSERYSNLYLPRAQSICFCFLFFVVSS